MKKDPIQQAANIAKVGIITLFSVVMFIVIKSHI
jgi:hypothetical protein